VAVDLDWSLYLNALGPRGRLHTVGIPPSAIPAHAFQLIGAQRSVSGSPLGSPATIRDMLEFCARHDISPMVERLPMSRIDEAMDKLKTARRATASCWTMIFHDEIPDKRSLIRELDQSPGRLGAAQGKLCAPSVLGLLAGRFQALKAPQTAP
jgi:hypothetical protein